jgi:mRNA interferase MazF
VERAVLVKRPALILTPRPIGPHGLLVWLAMITNAARPLWPGDVVIPEAETLGLLIPSKVRTAKILAAEAAAAVTIGRMPEATLREVQARVRDHLGFA